jgi:hypothetical protein
MTEIADSFMKVLGDQPLSLALVAMNLLLLWYCFRMTSSADKTRSEAVALIIAWQKESQAIMADCVSKEVMAMVLAALERDRVAYRAMLPSFSVPPTSPPEAPSP